MKKKIIAALTVIALTLGLYGCAAKNQPSQDIKQESDVKTIRVGILQYAEHVALDSARDGMLAALKDNGYIDGENIELDIQNAQGDPSNLLTMSQRFVNNKSDVVLAIATGAAQTMASQTKEIPIVFTAVTDPVGSGLVDTNEKPAGNVTGTNDLSPIKEQLELMLKISPEIKTIGILYSAGEDNSITQSKIVKEILDEMGVKWVEMTVASSNDVQQVTQSIVEKCDGIYIPTDNTFASAMPIVADIVMKSKTPVVCGDMGMVQEGGLATLGLSYYNLGYQTGEMAVRILKGESPADMSVESLTKYDYIINSEMAQAIGAVIPEDLKQYAK